MVSNDGLIYAYILDGDGGGTAVDWIDEDAVGSMAVGAAVGAAGYIVEKQGKN